MLWYVFTLPTSTVLSACALSVNVLFDISVIKELNERTNEPTNQPTKAQKHQISARFHTTSRFDREYLPNATDIVNRKTAWKVADPEHCSAMENTYGMSRRYE